MTIKHDQIIVVDIEATCWENHANPPDEYNEIIEIGVCLLDTRTFEPSDKKSILVIPEHSTISPFCTQLTTITPEMIAAEGIAFKEACELLQIEYESRNRLWVSWGNYDKRLFHEQCKKMDVGYPFSDHHANLKKVFVKSEKEKSLIGMPQAMEKLGLTLEGTHHRGVDDAWNTARIFGALLTKHGVGILRRYW
jgi:inhibitor of KinA sporulation pathway (predicted exonuclease)